MPSPTITERKYRIGFLFQLFARHKWVNKKVNRFSIKIRTVISSAVGDGAPTSRKVFRNKEYKNKTPATFVQVSYSLQFRFYFIGKLTITRKSLPLSVSAFIVPPCVSTIAFAIESPIP